ncbi:MAG: hypothetical protein AABX37_02770 [Nanoarchaeota archaeon]
MQKLIPTIYFYVLSAVGMVLFIVGLFNSVHYIVGITSYDKYPLRYGAESRCDYMPRAVSIEGTKETSGTDETRENCLRSLEKERETTKADDLEKLIAFTVIGLLVFSTHFYFARKQKST